MKLLSAALIVPGLLIAIGGVAGAQAVATPTLVENRVTALEALGYSSIRQTGLASDRLIATDARGSRVIVSFGPDLAVDRVDYLHSADQ